MADLVDMAQKQVFEIAEGNIKKETTAINALIDEAIKGIEIAGNRADGLSDFRLAAVRFGDYCRPSFHG